MDSESLNLHWGECKYKGTSYHSFNPPNPLSGVELCRLRKSFLSGFAVFTEFAPLQGPKLPHSDFIPN